MPSLHHREDPFTILQNADIGKRIAVHQDDIGEVPFLDLAQFFRPAPMIAPPNLVADRTASIGDMPTRLTKYSRSLAFWP